MTKKVYSDRILTPQQYLEQRVTYLPVERELLTELGIISNGQWNRDFIGNLDEIPLTLAMLKRQIVLPNENVQVVKPPIVGHDKYRDATLAPCISGQDLLFMAVIVRGGSGIENELKALQPKYKKWLLLLCNETAYMSNKLWMKCMNELEYRTRKRRETAILGMQPKNDFVLYTDNCTTHCTDQQAERLKRKNKIHHRSLIPNATHCQQMVDQNFGVTLKKDIKSQYWEWGESLLDQVDEGERKMDEKEGAQMKRAKIFEFAYNAAERISQNHHLIRKSWDNFGVGLPLDGSKDGDIETLHKNGGYCRGQDVVIGGVAEEQQNDDNDKEEAD